jgi:hypothetical protein
VIHHTVGHPGDDGAYDVAQICTNGHLVNGATRRTPVHNAAYCPACGAATTTMCARKQCQKPIPGWYWGPVSRGRYETPRFCDGCGWPYPWTSATLKAAREMAAELEGLTPKEREALARSLDDLVKDSPQTTLAATRFKKLVAKATTDGAAAAFKQLLVRAVTEGAKQLLWPGPPPIAGV